MTNKAITFNDAIPSPCNARSTLAVSQESQEIHELYTSNCHQLVGVRDPGRDSGRGREPHTGRDCRTEVPSHFCDGVTGRD